MAQAIQKVYMAMQSSDIATCNFHSERGTAEHAHQNCSDGSKPEILRLIEKNTQGKNCSAQRARLLEALRMFPVNSFEASRLLDIYHPPARVKELRNSGFNIKTEWTVVETESGRKHCIACYHLIIDTNNQPDLFIDATLN